MRWLSPASGSSSAAEPVPIHSPRAAERVIAEDRPRKYVVHLVLRLVLVHGDLLEHDLALLLELGEVERGAPDHVGHDVEGALEVAVQDTRVDRGRLLAGPGVELGAHGVEHLVDLQ